MPRRTKRHTKDSQSDRDLRCNPSKMQRGYLHLFMSSIWTPVQHMLSQLLDGKDVSILRAVSKQTSQLQTQFLRGHLSHANLGQQNIKMLSKLSASKVDCFVFRITLLDRHPQYPEIILWRQHFWPEHNIVWANRSISSVCTKAHAVDCDWADVFEFCRFFPQISEVVFEKWSDGECDVPLSQNVRSFKIVLQRMDCMFPPKIVAQGLKKLTLSFSYPQCVELSADSDLDYITLLMDWFKECRFSPLMRLELENFSASAANLVIRILNMYAPGLTMYINGSFFTDDMVSLFLRRQRIFSCNVLGHFCYGNMRKLMVAKKFVPEKLISTLVTNGWQEKNKWFEISPAENDLD